MNEGPVEHVRAIIVARLEDSIREIGLDPSNISDEFDLLTEGVIDSLGIVELIGVLEERLGFSIDLAELDPESLTVLGPLSRYIGNQYAQSIGSRRSA